MKRKTDPNPVRLQWGSTVQLIATVVGENEALALLVNPNLNGPFGEWCVAAVVTPATVQSSEDVLDHHSHKLVGTYPSLDEALRAAEGFAVAWRKGFKAAQSERCPCGEIGSDNDVSPPGDRPGMARTRGA